MTGPPPRFVSRGGLKLQAALDAFPITVAGRRALDVGASTGGFTDCLLQAGARRVVALDVGYGQLDWSLRNDSRVQVVERTNIRHADLAALGAPFDLVVADLSFIGLTTVAPHLAGAGHAATDHVLLVKPQFEVGRSLVERGGLVRDPAAHRQALAMVVEALAGVGVGAVGVIPSPITGAKGNREFLLWAREGAVLLGPGDLEEVVAS
jgi:23S rRNA (cytidine1920-2'-O)/16S rRNA (cytidine1409-2'-O)-methyltransferase